MANPAMVGSIGQGASIAGGVFGAFGALQQGAAQQNMYNYQAQIAQQNAQIAQQNSDYTLQAGATQAQDEGMRQAQIAGQIKASQASSGLDVNSGSAVQVQQSQHTTAMMDMNQIRSNAAWTAYNYQIQGVEDTNQAQLDTMAGANAEAAGNINAVSSILGSAASVSNQWLQANQVSLYNQFQ